MVLMNLLIQLTMKFDLELFGGAGEFAAFAFNQHDVVCNQKYGEIHPYSFHLKCVMLEARSNVDIKLWGKDIAEVYAVAAGHDLIEDARCSYSDIEARASVVVADAIYLLTENRGKSRKERHNEAYYSEIAENPHARYVKLCDILSNVKYSSLTNSSMLTKYRDEWETVRDILYRAPKVTTDTKLVLKIDDLLL